MANVGLLVSLYVVGSFRACARGEMVVSQLSISDSAVTEVSIPTKKIAPGVSMPSVSIGCGGEERTRAREIVSSWIELGGRGIDTAYNYGNHADVALAVQGSGVNRQDLFITSKIPGCKDTISYVTEELRLLDITYVDLLLLHSTENGSANCSEAWSILEGYVANGTIRAIGVSDFKPKDLEGLMKIAMVPPAIHQLHFNVLDRDDGVRSSQKFNITIEAYSPLASQEFWQLENEVLMNIAARHGVTVYQVALRWILQQGHLLTFQSSSREHQLQDADLFSFNLTADELTQINELERRAPGIAARLFVGISIGAFLCLGLAALLAIRRHCRAARTARLRQEKESQDDTDYWASMQPDLVHE